MIVSTDQQAFSVTILVKGEEEGSRRREQEEQEEQEEQGRVVEEGEHQVHILEGLQGLRDQGLLLDTRLWAQGHSFQVRLLLDILLLVFLTSK